MKSLVAFFSASGITKEVALSLADVAGAEIFEITPKVPYSRADLDWTNEQSRTTIECKDKGSRPEFINAEKLDISQFDCIFIGFPIWWYNAPHIIYTFLQSYDFSGKIIVPFCTSGGSELGNTPKDLQKLCKGAIFKEGRRFNFGQNRASFRKWLETLGL